MIDAPAHAVEEEGGAREFLACEVVACEAYVPHSVLTLALQQGLAHLHEVLSEEAHVLALHCLAVVEALQASHQCGINPSVAATPIALLAVGLAIGRHEVLVAPPKAVFLVEKSASERVATPFIHLHGMLEVFLLAGYQRHLHIYGHCHLNGINPRPPRIEVFFLRICAGLCLVPFVLGYEF